MTIQELSERIKAKALDLGFSAVGIASLEPMAEHSAWLSEWLEAGCNAGMAYMENYKEKRLNPSKLVGGAKSAVVVLMNYKQPHRLEGSEVAQYAYGVDYHFFIKEKLGSLLSFLKTLVPEASGRVFVDSAPVLEKALAHRAGLGWIGKNSLLLNPQFGSTTYIGTLFLDLELEYNRTQLPNGCGECRRCIEACPTGAIYKPRMVDARRCISYLNKSHAGELPAEQREAIGGRLWGCDECIQACPYNQKTPTHNQPELMPLPELFQQDLSNLSRTQLRKLIMRKPPKK